MNDVYVIGAGIHPFGRHDGKSGLDLGVDAIRLALEDGGLDGTTCRRALAARQHPAMPMRCCPAWA